jgi:hypothetical protein
MPVDHPVDFVCGCDVYKSAAASDWRNFYDCSRSE